MDRVSSGEVAEIVSILWTRFTEWVPRLAQRSSIRSLMTSRQRLKRTRRLRPLALDTRLSRRAPHCSVPFILLCTLLSMSTRYSLESLLLARMTP